MTDESGEKKIIIDEDWKSQVEAEKAALKEDKKQAETKAEEEPTKDSESVNSESVNSESAPGPGKMPEASFAMLLTTLASEAMVSLGQIPHPGTGEAIVNLDQARYFIDTLGILHEKTKGNLSDEEGPMLDSMLHQLRMAFLAAQKAPTSQSGDS